MPDSTRIVITGGPGSGKTEFFERLKSESELAGFLFLEELARQILSGDPIVRHDPVTFHREIYRRQIEREEAAGDRPFVTDRGTADVFAFHPETATDVGTSLEVEYQRYSHVIQLGSAAALGTAFYVRDNVRREDIGEALSIETALREIWSAHPQYHFLPASRQIAEKYSRFRDLIVSNM